MGPSLRLRVRFCRAVSALPPSGSCRASRQHRADVALSGATILCGGTFMSSLPNINGERLWSRLMQMGQTGATAHGGCNRQALTELDFDGRRLLLQWAHPLGCEARV